MIRRVAVLGLVLLFAYSCAPTMTSKVIQGGLVAAEAADVHSTKLALASGKGREGNPLLPESWIGQGLIKAAATAGVIWLGTTMEIHGHRTLARVAQTTFAAVTAIVAARNYNIAR